MKVKWLGHASFLITSDSGTKIITDPYATGSGLRYGEIKESADIVTVSHEHFDHNNVAAVGGNPAVVKGDAEAKGMKFKGIATYHDASEGKERGNNTIICFEVDGVRVCHLGDLGHPLSSQEVDEVGKVDVLLTPVGGFFTIDAKVASEVCSKLSPRVIIPMHFKNDRLDFPIAGVEDFLQGKEGVTKPDSSEAEFKAGALPRTTQIVVLKPAL
jgi:L-ascorbate metabolism protein UlaG (beta-lactamase superfamily)